MSNNKKKRGGGNNNPQRYTGKNVNVMGDSGRMEKHAIDVFRDMNRQKYYQKCIRLCIWRKR